MDFNAKMKESFLAKLRLFLFKKAFEVDDVWKFTQNDFSGDFAKFKISNELANLYSSRYYQLLKSDEITLGGVTKTVEDIIKALSKDGKYLLSNSNLESLSSYEKCENEYKKRFMSEDDFKAIASAKTCAYCGVSVEQIEALGAEGKLNNKRSDTRGYTLEIDRKLPNLEYSKENCCMACYWCNNAKTDEFSPKQFRPIAKGINKMWNKKFGAKVVAFPKYSDVWAVDFDSNLNSGKEEK